MKRKAKSHVHFHKGQRLKFEGEEINVEIIMSSFA